MDCFYSTHSLIFNVHYVKHKLIRTVNYTCKTHQIRPYLITLMWGNIRIVPLQLADGFSNKVQSLLPKFPGFSQIIDLC